MLTWRGLAALAAAVLAPAACNQSPDSQANAASSPQRAAPDTGDRTSPGALRHRADVYWQAKATEDWSTVFDFRDPRDLDGVDREDFENWSRANEPFRVHKAEVGEVLTDVIGTKEKVGWVQVDLLASMRRFPDLPARDATRWEPWRVVEGDWYPVPLLEYESYPASPAVRDEAAEKALLARFEKSWALRMKRDWEALYDMAEPEDHLTVPFYQFAASHEKTSYLEREVHWVEVIQNRGRVRVRLTHKLTDPNMTKLPPKVIVLSEPWVRIDGEWFMDLNQPTE